MRVTQITPILNVSDVDASLAWFESLGWTRGFTYNRGGLIAGARGADANGPAIFAGLCANRPGADTGPQVFLCRDGQGLRDARPVGSGDGEDFGAVWMSWWVEDTDAAHADAIKAKVQIVRPPENKPWGVREFLIRHPDGHVFRVSGPAK